jgi:hypothetical protein
MDNWHKVVILDVSSYAGSSIGAVHTYGQLIHTMDNNRKKVTVERPMTAAEAKTENKKDRDRGFEMMHKPGQITSRLRDEEDVIEVALGMWEEHFPYAQVLLMRREWSSEPGKILASPDEKVALNLNVLWVDYLQAIDEGWGDDEIIEVTNLWRNDLNNFLASLPEMEYVPEPDVEEHDWNMADFLMREAKLRKEKEEERKKHLEKQERQRAEARAEFKAWCAEQEFEEIEITVKARTTIIEKEDGTARGYLMFFMAATDVYSDDGEERLGAVKSGMDASVWLNHKSIKHPYQIKTQDLWYAFMVALDAKQEEDERQIQDQA